MTALRPRSTWRLPGQAQCEAKLAWRTRQQARNAAWRLYRHGHAPMAGSSFSR